MFLGHCVPQTPNIYFNIYLKLSLNPNNLIALSLVLSWYICIIPNTPHDSKHVHNRGLYIQSSQVQAYVSTARPKGY